MKRFLTLTFLFIGSVLAGMTLLIYLNSIIIEKYALKEEKDIQILILGDSNIECALNDSLISHSQSYAQSGTAYFYNYLKLKKILKNGITIDTVLLSFAPHNIYKNIEEIWLYDNTHMKSRLREYFPILSKEEYKILSHNRKGLIGSVPKVIRGSLYNISLYLMKGDKISLYYGGYQFLIRNKLEEGLTRLAGLEKKGREDFEIAETEMLYLRKIIDECIIHDIELILINTPKNDKIWNSLTYGAEVFYEYYQKHFSDVSLLDLHDFPLPASSFGDPTHLNHEGARIFSNYINDTGLSRLMVLSNEQD